MFIVIARVNCDYLLNSLSEMKLSLQLLQESVDKISSEQVKTHEKVNQLQRDISKILNVTSDVASSDAENPDSTDNLDNKFQEEEEEKVIVVSGGYSTYTTVEAISLDGTPLCTLPDLPDARRRHTMDGHLLCGGYDTYTSCLHYIAGKWTRFRRNFVKSRSYHVSWMRPDGEVVLLGGEYSMKTSEVVTASGEQRSYDLKHNTYYACAIKLDKFVIITGGKYSKTLVSKYDMNGWMKDLATLNTGRYNHGCGFYYRDTNELTYLVTGGHDNGGHRILSTEIMSSSLARWVYVGNLPTAMYGLKGISISNQIFITGGSNGTDIADILKYNPATDQWEKTGNMNTARHNHAVAALPLKEVEPFCS